MWGWITWVCVANAAPTADVRLERPIAQGSGWQVLDERDRPLGELPGWWNFFYGVSTALGERKNQLVLGAEIGSRGRRFIQSRQDVLRGSEVWGAAQAGWRIGLNGPRTDAAWPSLELGAGWSWGTNGVRTQALLFTPHQGPQVSSALQLELPGQRPARPFVELRFAAHAALAERVLSPPCPQGSECFGVEGNAGGWRLGLGGGVRIGRPGSQDAEAPSPETEPPAPPEASP
jgi:hypothetical protein